MKLTRLFSALLGMYAMSLSAAEKPDVLFIAVDDLNDWVGHLRGHPQARTPNIDRLVARGTAFTNAHCAAPACNPSRAALMSGLRPWQTGIYTNEDSAGGIMKDIITINRHFLAEGYNTQGGGKIYHGGPSEGREDTWTVWKSLFPGTKAHESNMNGLNKGHFDWGVLDGKTEDLGDSKMTDWAIEVLKTAPLDQPLFLAAGYVKPHLPWYVPQEFYDRFPLESIQLPTVKDDDLADIPPPGIKMAKPEGDHASVIKGDQWKKAVQAYLATTSYLDDQVGRLLDGLDASPRKDRTIIVWWTDHGWSLGEKQHWRKFALWEETTRTSFSIVAPGVTQPGSVCNAGVDYTMIYPTLCELTGLPLPAHVKGASLVPLLKDSNAPWEHVAICTHDKGNHALKNEKWRYIRYADGSEELYDHTQDPNEWTNLAGVAGMSEVKSRLAAHLPPEGSEVPSVREITGGRQKGKAKAAASQSKNRGKGKKQATVR
jgi:arylsulfatase A-like enzyme